MSRSDKPAVITYLFDQLYDAKTKTFKRTIVTNDDVVQAIQYCNTNLGTKLSTNNPANFLKDVVRGQNASKNWPPKISALQITAKQRPGDGQVFEFIPFATGQTEPFPDIYKPSGTTPRHRIQSVSLPLASKALGRQDEPWLIQVAINLRVVETHFALFSKVNVVELNHLQTNIKLRKTEIDALFAATCSDTKAQFSAIITCEAKQKRERILEDQIVNQVLATFASVKDAKIVIPMGIKTAGKSSIYIAEFEPVTRTDIATLEKTEKLDLATEVVYELSPYVNGI